MSAGARGGRRAGAGRPRKHPVNNGALPQAFTSDRHQPGQAGSPHLMFVQLIQLHHIPGAQAASAKIHQLPPKRRELKVRVDAQQ